MDIYKYTSEITRLRMEADNLSLDAPGAVMMRIELLAKCLVYIGRLSSYLDGQYKRVYAERKRLYAETYVRTLRGKEAMAELAVADLRLAEANAYEMMHRWRNAFESTQEEIHSLKLRMRVDIADGNSNYVAYRGRDR